MKRLLVLVASTLAALGLMLGTGGPIRDVSADTGGVTCENDPSADGVTCVGTITTNTVTISIHHVGPVSEDQLHTLAVELDNVLVKDGGLNLPIQDEVNLLAQDTVVTVEATLEVHVCQVTVTELGVANDNDAQCQ